MKPPESDESLSRTLAAWRVTPRRDPQFRPQVWDRLKRGESASWLGYARNHASLVIGALALAVVLGAVTGREQARSRVAADSNRLAASYVQALDARTMRMP